ncbi:GPW/gp25 family protein [Mitsuaria sp. GD03876]|uniref:GPW/gp25 family protein n=1 Tax=Mitsuaria sp. GD03876 TaxID=2975399 RepID=UPI0024493735|nr:GPW/gp25 family protein [Mitsuaria sp. GD03876]MDH0867506.1 GPW/gp25 family protein [Mitsuaria sp. GD03876]
MATPRTPSTFLGQGWAFPVGIEAGQTATAAYDEDVRQAILIIVGTNPGERVMRPDFGAGLNAFVFEPLNPSTLEAIRQRVLEALVDWEPRIDVTAVTAVADVADTGKVRIEMSYRVRATNSHANLVYPFYLEEGSAQ